MSVFLVGPSAAEYYRRYRNSDNFAAAHRVRIPKEFSLDSNIAESFAVRYGLSIPLHIGSTERSKLRSNEYRMCHLLNRDALGKCAIAVKDGLYVASPELLFLQAALELNYAQLLKFGFEICGTYQLDDLSPYGFSDAEPLTTAARIRSFLDRCQGAHGAKLARSAAAVLRDGAASPREGQLAARVLAPPQRGGYGLKGAELNWRVDLTDEERIKFGKDHFACDLYWPGWGVAIEYDSDMFHTGSQRIAADSERRNYLSCKDVNVVAMTREQFATVYGSDLVMQTVAHLAGRRMLLDSDASRLRRENLLRSLTKRDMPWPWGLDDLQ